MHPDDHVCLCFHVPLGKIRAFVARENPPVASLISECLGAGTGCGWCVPFLKHLHRCHATGAAVDLAISPEAYARDRLTYQRAGRHPAQPTAGLDPAPPAPPTTPPATATLSPERQPPPPPGPADELPPQSL